MAEETTTDGTSTPIFIEEEVGQGAEAPTGDTTSGSGVPTGRGEPPPADAPPPDSEVEVVPAPDAPTGDSTPPNPSEPVKGDPAADVPQDDFTESGASPEPDGEFNEPAAAPEPPPVPEVIDPSTDTVLVSGAIDESGTQTILIDRDGDGLFETRVEGVDLGDGTFKVVSEPELLDEPFSPSEIGDAPEEPPEDATAPPALPEAGEFIDPNEVDVVETRPGFFEADLDGDGTNDVEFRGSVGDDGLIKVERIRPIDGEGQPEINEDNADEAGNTGTPEINEDNAPPLVEVDPENPDGEPRPLEPDAGDDGIKVVDVPGGEDAVDPGGPPNIFPADPKDEGQTPPPGGLDENEEIQPDKEPDPVDRLRPDREAPPPEGEAPVEPPTGEVAPEPPAAEEQPPAGEVAPEPPAGEVAPEPPVHEPPAGEVTPEPPAAEPPAYEPPAAGHEPPTEAEVDLPGLYDAPPEYASGSDGGGHAPPSGNGEPTTVPIDDPAADVPGVPAADCEPETDDPADEPIEVNAEEDGDDAGLLEQVADAVGDLWDDAKDAVT